MGLDLRGSLNVSPSAELSGMGSASHAYCKSSAISTYFQALNTCHQFGWQPGSIRGDTARLVFTERGIVVLRRLGLLLSEGGERCMLLLRCAWSGGGAPYKKTSKFAGQISLARSRCVSMRVHPCVHA